MPIAPTDRLLLRSLILVLGAFAALGSLTAYADSRHSRRSEFDVGFSGDLGWALVRDGGDHLSQSGDPRDNDVVQDLARRGGDFLYVRSGNDRYVIRDPDLMSLAEQAIEPSQQLAREQGRLGRRQGELGRRQGGLGRRQGDLGRRQGLLAAERARLEARIANAEERGLSTRGYEDRERDLRSEMESLRAQQEELSRQQESLAHEQEPLAREQKRLGHEQEKLAPQLSDRMRELLRDALRQGKAEPVR